MLAKSCFIGYNREKVWKETARMPMNSYSVPLKKVVEEFHLTVEHASTDFEKVKLMVEEVSRPGVQLSGFFQHFEPLRLQVIGNVEYAYTKTLSHEQLLSVFEEMFSRKIPALIFARNMEPLPECLEMAKIPHPAEFEQYYNL